MKTLYRQILKVVLVIFIMGIIGCAAGPAYQKVEKIPENSSVVYIYRPGFAGWPEVNPNLYTDKGKTFLTKIYSVGYFPYIVKPGEVDFSAARETESTVTLDVKPRQIYYIKVTIGRGIFVERPHLTIVPPDVGAREIKRCKLITKEN